jgi:predicted TIM-barrel fold metal-dependent hydrolase
MKYIDVHTHVFPDNVANKVVNQLEGYYKLTCQGKGDFADLIKNITEANLTKTVIFSTATKAAQVVTINDYIAALCKQDERFIGFGTLHPDYPDIAEELVRFKTLGLKGLKLHPDFQQFYIDEPKLDAIYQAIPDNMPILIHVGDENVDYSAPERLAKVMDKYPNLVFIAAHFGGYCRWEDAKKCLFGRRNLYLDTSSCFGKISYSQGREMIRLHGADRVLFASDYPAQRSQQSIQDVLNMELTLEENELIFYKNAQRLLGL